MERVTGIEPAWPAWKAGALPLSYTREVPGQRNGPASLHVRRRPEPRRRALMEKISLPGHRRSRHHQHPQGMALLDHELAILRAELSWLDKHAAAIGRPSLVALV